MLREIVLFYPEVTRILRVEMIKSCKSSQHTEPSPVLCYVLQGGIAVIAFLCIGGIFLTIALGFLCLSLYSSNQSHWIAVSAELHKSKSYRNVWIKRRHIPVYTEYTYAYKVKGKVYYYQGAEEKGRRTLHPRATIVYLKGFPRIASLESFSCTSIWILTVMIFLMSGIFFIPAFL